MYHKLLVNQDKKFLLESNLANEVASMGIVNASFTSSLPRGLNDQVEKNMNLRSPYSMQKLSKDPNDNIFIDSKQEMRRSQDIEKKPVDTAFRRSDSQPSKMSNTNQIHLEKLNEMKDAEIITKSFVPKKKPKSQQMKMRSKTMNAVRRGKPIIDFMKTLDRAE